MLKQIHLTSKHGSTGPKNKNKSTIAVNKTWGEFSTEKVLEFSRSIIAICLDFSFS